MKVKRISHKGYNEFLRAKIRKVNVGKHPIKQLFGRYQYIFSHKNYEISLIEIKYGSYGFLECEDFWEIYQLKGKKLFIDNEQFKTKELAIKRVEQAFSKFHRFKCIFKRIWTKK